MLQISWYWFLRFFNCLMVNTLNAVFQIGVGEANYFRVHFLATSHLRMSRVGPKQDCSVIKYDCWTILLQSKSLVTELNIHHLCIGYWLRSSSYHFPAPVTLLWLPQEWEVSLSCTPGRTQFFTNRPTGANGKETKTIGVKIFAVVLIRLNSF